MSFRNHVEAIGNLARAPYLKYIRDNMAVCQGTVATNTRYKDPEGAWKEEAAFIPFTMFGETAERFANMHESGSQVFLIGRIRQVTQPRPHTRHRVKEMYLFVEHWIDVRKGAQSAPAAQHVKEAEEWDAEQGND